MKIPYKLYTPHEKRIILISNTDTVEDFMNEVLRVTELSSSNSNQHQNSVIVISAGERIVDYSSKEYAGYKDRNFSELCKDKTGWGIDTLHTFHTLIESLPKTKEAQTAAVETTLNEVRKEKGETHTDLFKRLIELLSYFLEKFTKLSDASKIEIENTINSQGNNYAL